MIYGGKCKKSQDRITRSTTVIGYGLLVYDFGVTGCDFSTNGPRSRPIIVRRRRSSSDFTDKERAWRAVEVSSARLCIRSPDV